MSEAIATMSRPGDTIEEWESSPGPSQPALEDPGPKKHNYVLNDELTEAAADHALTELARDLYLPVPTQTLKDRCLEVLVEQAVKNAENPEKHWDPKEHKLCQKGYVKDYVHYYIKLHDAVVRRKVRLF